MLRLPKLVTLVPLLLALCAAPVTAQQRAEPAPSAGSLVEAAVRSTALAGNLLKDSAEQRVAVYLPPSYATSPGRRYPTLYLLHGFLGTNEVWTKDGYQGMSLATMMDDLIRRGVSREMIVVAPNGMNAYRGSFYVNSATNGGWADFVSRELVAHVDATYRTLARPESRGIAGHSMGGFGAVVLAMRHPDVFGAVYALSPCCLALEGDMGTDNPAWAGTLKITSPDQLPREIKSFEEFFQVAFVALSAAFSPAPDKGPLYVEYPFVERDGRLVPNEPAYTKWRANMPLYLVEEYRQNFEKLRGIYLDYGENEEFSHIRAGTSGLSRELTERRIPHSFEVYAGGDHGNKIRERLETRVLRFFSDVLAN